MGECKLCVKNGEDLPLLQANHKDLGQIMVCRECWKKPWVKNRTVCGHYRLKRHMFKLRIENHVKISEPYSLLLSQN